MGGGGGGRARESPLVRGVHGVFSTNIILFERQCICAFLVIFGARFQSFWSQFFFLENIFFDAREIEC